MAMLDSMMERARDAGAGRILGYYRRTPKNGMVEDHYAKLGFDCISRQEDGSESAWCLAVPGYERRTRHIALAATAHA